MSEESFSEFKTSFSYGSRGDLNFKFLKSLDDAEAAALFQDILRAAARGHDRNDWSELIQVVHKGQKAAYAGPSNWSYDEGPFTPLSVPISQARIGLITSTGHFVEGNDPEPFGVKNMSQEEAADRVDEFLREEPTLSGIPIDTSADQLRVRHGGYDISGSVEDRNVNLPIDRLREMEAEGRLGTLHPVAYSFVGACAQTRLTRQTAPAWIEMWQQQEWDAALLVPV